MLIDCHQYTIFVTQNTVFLKIHIDKYIKKCIQKLGLPEDYPWIVKTGSKKGFHIIIRIKDFSEKTSSQTAFAYYTPNEKRIELRWKGHLVLPPSIHYSGNIYSFYRNQIPSIIPHYIELKNVEQLIEDFCGENHFVSFNWNQIHCKLIERRNNNAIDSGGNIFFQSRDIKWYEACNTSQTNNSLALKYLYGNEVISNKQKAYELFLKADNDQAYFNLASLISIGYFEGTRNDVEILLGKLDYNRMIYVEGNYYQNYMKNKIEEEIENIRKNAKKYAKETGNDYLLFFDTETTGLPKDYNAPSSNTFNWPRLVQLSWILTDEERHRIRKRNLIVKPDGFVIPVDSTLIHGITTERANEEGIPLADAIEQFKADLEMATFIVGHNVNFDKKVVGAEMIRLGMADEMESKKSYCTMLSSINYCKILGKDGYKYPKLQELYRKLFGKEFEDAHDALCDTEATEKCFWELKKQGII